MIVWFLKLTWQIISSISFWSRVCSGSAFMVFLDPIRLELVEPVSSDRVVVAVATDPDREPSRDPPNIVIGSVYFAKLEIYRPASLTSTQILFRRASFRILNQNWQMIIGFSFMVELSTAFIERLWTIVYGTHWTLMRSIVHELRVVIITNLVD